MCSKGPRVANETFNALTWANEVDDTMWRLSANAASMSGERQALPVTAGIETHWHWAIVLMPTT